MRGDICRESEKEITFREEESLLFRIEIEVSFFVARERDIVCKVEGQREQNEDSVCLYRVPKARERY